MTELQGNLLKLLKKIDDICREIGVEYYLFGGTLLGAIRHKGFIPWDDDADIIMTRDNWNTFLEKSKDKLPEGYILSSLDTDPTIAMTVNHFVNTKTTEIYRYHLTNPEEAGMPIDIQVMDPLPDDNESYNKYIRSVIELQDFTNRAYYYALRDIVEPGSGSHYKKNVFLEKFLGKEKVIERIKKGACDHPEESASFYSQRYGNSPLLYPKEFFGKPKYVKFETIELPVPQYAEDVLLIAYGDWSNIPRGGSTKTTHEYSVRSDTIPSSTIFKEFDSIVDRNELIDVYHKKKLEQDKNVYYRTNSLLNRDIFLQQKTRMDYERTTDESNIKELFEAKRYGELYDFFQEYISVQFEENFTGSPSVIGWKRWFRRHRPMLIDIGSESMAIVLFLLLHYKRLVDAEKLVKAISFNNANGSVLLNSAINAVKLTRDALRFFERNDYQNCSESLNESLGIFEDNPYLFILECKLDRVLENDHKTLLKKIDKYLNDYIDDDELLFEKAVLLKNDSPEAAYEYFEKVISISNNGLILTSIKMIIESDLSDDPDNKKLLVLYYKLLCCLGYEKEVIVDDFELFDEENVSELGMELSNDDINDDANSKQEYCEIDCSDPDVNMWNNIKQIRLNLLKEFDEMCRKSNIEYFLWGNTLRECLKCGQYFNLSKDISIAMTSENAKKFLDIYLNNLKNDRAINCMLTSPNYRRLGFRYCDTSTLDFIVTECGEGDIYGIFINVEILRYEAVSSFKEKFVAMLERGWQLQNYNKYYNKKNSISMLCVKSMIALLGKKRTAKLLFGFFMKEGMKGDKNKVFVMPFQRKKFFVKDFYEYEIKEFSYNGLTIFAHDIDRLYNDGFQKDDCADGCFLKPLSQRNRIVDPYISAHEYLKYLDDNGVDRKKLWSVSCKGNSKYAKVFALNKKVEQYWGVMSKIGRLHMVYDYYDGKSEMLNDMYDRGEYEQLNDSLKLFKSIYPFYKKHSDKLSMHSWLIDLYEKMKIVKKSGVY